MERLEKFAERVLDVLAGNAVRIEGLEAGGVAFVLVELGDDLRPQTSQIGRRLHVGVNQVFDRIRPPFPELLEVDIGVGHRRGVDDS